MIRTLVALGLLLLAACTTSPVPITSPDGKQSDEALLGRWQYTLEDETETIFIKKVDGELLVTGESSEGGGPSPGDFRVIVARLGDQRYASFTDAELAAGNHPRKYILTRYRFRDADHVELYLADEDLLMDAVSRKQIAGKPLEDRHTSGVELSASTEALQGFIRAHGPRIFNAKLLVLSRLKQPAVPSAGATPRRP